MTAIALITIIISLQLLTACSQQEDQNQVENTGKYAPVISKNPKHFMVINGNISNKFPNPIKLSFIINYITTNINCEVITNKWEGVGTYRLEQSIFLVQPNLKGDYQIKFPLDKYEKGYCGWQIGNISYQVNNNDSSPFALFNDKAKNMNTKVENTLTCPDTSSHVYCKDINYPYYTKNAMVNFNKNYIYTLNVKP